jgi:hypothetical protein
LEVGAPVRIEQDGKRPVGTRTATGKEEGGIELSPSEPPQTDPRLQVRSLGERRDGGDGLAVSPDRRVLLRRIHPGGDDDQDAPAGDTVVDTREIGDPLRRLGAS